MLMMTRVRAAASRTCTGADTCDNCGADLAGNDMPAAGARRSTAACSASTSTTSARRRPLTVEPGHAGRRGDRPDAGRRGRLRPGRRPTTGSSASSPTAMRCEGGRQAPRRLPRPRLHDPRPGRPPPRRPDRRRDPQDGRRRLPAHPDRRGRPPDRRRHRPRRLPPPRADARTDAAADRGPRPGPDLAGPPGAGRSSAAGGRRRCGPTTAPEFDRRARAPTSRSST